MILAATSTATAQPAPHAEHEFFFTRAIYSGLSDLDDWGPRWAIDFPQAEQHFLVALQRLTGIDAYALDNAIEISDQALRDYPFVYAVEVGAITLSEGEREALRAYLLAGGFLVIDDFWGTWAWQHLEQALAALLPEFAIREVPLSHPIFHAFYDLDQIMQVPNAAQAGTGKTHEFDGHTPHVRGIFDHSGRLMVLINWNTDLGDAWEWADEPTYPLRYSTFAFEFGVNIVIYSMTF
ncbi:MAG: DUF4159 domain-containing protein [Gammaproteobacteria bacterium]|nr:DUF4159 domain-containing protein [Gammaproteobacteria bacterium]